VGFLKEGRSKVAFSTLFRDITEKDEEGERTKVVEDELEHSVMSVILVFVCGLFSLMDKSLCKMLVDERET
jgi:hypothetical protein